MQPKWEKLPRCESELTGGSFVIIGEAPGFHEVTKKRPFVGASGGLIREAFALAGVDFTSVAKINVVSFRPPGNETPTPDAIEWEWERFERDMREAHRDAQSLLFLGDTAKNALARLLGDKDIRNRRVSQLRGKWWSLWGKPVMVTWHPAYCLRNGAATIELEHDVRRFVLNLRPITSFKGIQTRLVTSEEEAITALSNLNRSQPLVYDIETTGLVWYDRPQEPKAEITTLGFSDSPHSGLVVPFSVVRNNPHLKSVVSDVLTTGIVTGHNIKFDTHMSRAHGIQVRATDDTMLMSYVLNEDDRLGLEHISSRVLNTPDWKEVVLGEYKVGTSKVSMYQNAPMEALAKYLTLDLVTTHRLHTYFETCLKTEGMYDAPYKSIMMPGHHLMVQMEREGMIVDTALLDFWIHRVNTALSKVQNCLKELTYPEYNPNSYPQTARVVYDTLPLNIPVSIRAGRSTDIDVLITLQGQHVFIDTLILYRKLFKLRSAYLLNIKKHMGVDGRVHPSYNLAGTATGRLSAKDPPIQTMPNPARAASDPHNEEICRLLGIEPDENGTLVGFSGVVRSLFVPPDGFVYIDSDYAQAEVRAMVHLSGVRHLKETYKKDPRADIHGANALRLFGEGYSKGQRSACKILLFGVVMYGGSVTGSLGPSLGFDPKEAKKVSEELKVLFAEHYEYAEQNYQFVRKHGYLQMMPMNRRRHWRVVTPANAAEVKREVMNATYQAAASDMLLLSAIRLQERGYRVVLLMHDGCLTIAQPEDKDEITRIIQDTAEEFMGGVPWICDSEVKSRWYEGFGANL